jgi:hypothetical protein
MTWREVWTNRYEEMDMIYCMGTSVSQVLTVAIYKEDK